jgi:hypothetical protein
MQKPRPYAAVFATRKEERKNEKEEIVKVISNRLIIFYLPFVKKKRG